MADGKKRSEILAHFPDIQSSDPAIRLSECIHYGIKIKNRKGNTTNMWNHTKAKHPGKLVSKSTAVRSGNSGAEGKGEASGLMQFEVT